MRVLILFLLSISFFTVKANLINADSSNYTSSLSGLTPSDTLHLAPGTYTNRLNLFSIVGTASDPIVIMGSGNSTVFLGNACCNTVSIKESAYLIIQDFKIDGANITNIDGIKAEGTTGNWAHHIVIDNILIVGHGGNQQTVGISTKCPAWDWTIRNCIVDSAGTGMYLGNSNGEAPFVNGIVEFNVVKNTVGYNIEIKHQNVGSRNIAGMTLDGRTIIRHNVFSKETNASSGGSARPNLLVGNFPDSLDGSNDYYEIYGNFLWQNPNESLFQGTGNIHFYDNICVNYAGGNGIAFQSHNGFMPRDIKVFHNTIVSDQNWGIRFMDTDPAYQKYINANVVFSDHVTPIRIVGGGVASANLADNITDGIANANNYVSNASNNITTLDLYPVTGSALKSTLISNALFSTYADFDKDFNLTNRNWLYRGAYTDEGTNPGWKLAIETKITTGNVVGIHESNVMEDIQVFPNPTKGIVNIDLGTLQEFSLKVLSINGQLIYTEKNIHDTNYHFELEGAPGIYFIEISTGVNMKYFKILKN